MTETPYQLMLRKERERRSQLVYNIENKDLKRRSISYNLKIVSQTSNDPEEKNKKDQTKINFSNSAKKSYFYRKFFNRTVQGLTTSEDFQRFKRKMIKGNSEGLKEGHPAFLRQILDQEISFKPLLRGKEQIKLQIIVQNKDTKKADEKTHKSLKNGALKSNQIYQDSEQKIENITDIAERRKLSLDFDLQILGNKKNIRIKDLHSSKSPSKAKQKESLITISVNNAHLVNSKEIDKQQSFMLSRTDDMRPPCTFLKHLQQQTQPEIPQQSNVNIKVIKLKHTLGLLSDLSSDDGWAFGRSNTTEYKPNLGNPKTLEAFHPPERYQERQIRSSWNHCSQGRRYSFNNHTASEKRSNLNKKRKETLNCYLNDIKGWNVQKQQDSEQDELFIQQ